MSGSKWVTLTGGGGAGAVTVVSFNEPGEASTYAKSRRAPRTPARVPGCDDGRGSEARVVLYFVFKCEGQSAVGRPRPAGAASPSRGETIRMLLRVIGVPASRAFLCTPHFIFFNCSVLEFPPFGNSFVTMMMMMMRSAGLWQSVSYSPF